jgi:hypothetical protein
MLLNGGADGTAACTAGISDDLSAQQGSGMAAEFEAQQRQENEEAARQGEQEDADRQEVIQVRVGGNHQFAMTE